MFDMEESGRQIGEKLFLFLNLLQKEELLRFIIEQKNSSSHCLFPKSCLQNNAGQPLTEIQEGDLYFCLEHRLVKVCGREIMLTAREFDILALLIRNPCRVFTYEMIMELVWNEDGALYSRKAIINHASNLRKKLKVSDTVPDYIKSVRGIGYKFDKK